MPLIETVPALNEAREAIESSSILIVIAKLFLAIAGHNVESPHLLAITDSECADPTA